MPTKLTHDSADPAAYDAQRAGHFEDRRVDLISNAILAQQVSKVLELGAGSGRICWRLANDHPSIGFTAVEPFRPLADHGRTRYPSPNLARVDSIPKGARHGLAFSIDVIHHLDDRSSVLAQLRNALADGAVWIAVEPNIWHPAIWLLQERMRRAGLGEDHFRPWVSEPEIRRAGFDIESRSYHHLWPAALKHPPPIAVAAERRFERSRLLGASVVYQLRASG
jgi:trans-aconitate methyltransferase